MTRIVFLGLGAAARHIHLPACRFVPGLEIVGGADPDGAARQAFAREAGSLDLRADGSALLQAVRPDWVLIGAPPARHRELCLLALEHGAHVFCEKPFVASVAEADEVIAAARDAGRVVAVNHEFPSMPIHAALIAAARDELFGRALLLQAWQTVRLQPADLQGWRSNWKTMREFGTHAVDLALTIFGGPPLAVTGRMPQAQGAQGDLVDLVVLEFSGGRSASIVLNRLCPGRHRYFELRLDTERESLRSSIGGRLSASVFVSGRTGRPGLELDFARGGMAWIERETGRKILARNPGNVFAHATGVHLRAVLDAVARGVEPPAVAHRAREVVSVVEAAYRSARDGRTIPIEHGRRGV